MKIFSALFLLIYDFTAPFYRPLLRFWCVFLSFFHTSKLLGTLYC